MTPEETKALNDLLATWDWPYQRINSNGAKEYSCPHGVGHGGIHGCDGCCRAENFPGRKKWETKTLRAKQ